MMSVSVLLGFWRKGAAIVALGVVLLGGTAPEAAGADAHAAVKKPVVHTPYVWRSLAIGGGGYVTGIVVHPRVPDLIYIRTDVGGAYRFSAKPDTLARNWIPLTDHFTRKESNYYGIESLALDASNPEVVYIAAGKYEWAGKGRLFKSMDRGATWRALPLEVAMQANGAYRETGERLAVDPYNGKTVFFGSRNDGLFVSRDAGASWKNVKSLPDAGTPGRGVMFVLFDRRPVAFGLGGEAHIYAGVYGKGLVRSDDDGASWQVIGGPARPLRGVVARDGTLIVTSLEGVHRLKDGTWREITPRGANKAFGAISSHPDNAKTLVVSPFAGAHNLPLFVSRDQGETWDAFSLAAGNVAARPNVPWWTSLEFAGATSALAFDPHNPRRLWLTDWSGTWFAENFGDRILNFKTLERGHEEIVPTMLLAPPRGAFLISAAVDVTGFRHEFIDSFPNERLSPSASWNSFGLDYMADDPDRLVRVGPSGDHGVAKSGMVSLSRDNGRTWVHKAWPRESLPMKVAQSASDPNVFVVLPLNDKPWRTKDGGASFEPGTGVGGTAIASYWHWTQPIAADRVKGQVFYLYTPGHFYRSEDGGLTWQGGGALPASGQAIVATAPGEPGVVWVALDAKGLFVSRDFGATFTHLPNVKRALLFALGKPGPLKNQATLFLYGQVDRSKPDQIFRSTDSGATWEEIDDPAQPIGNDPVVMAGDWQSFGRVAIGTNGRGIFVGMPRP